MHGQHLGGDACLVKIAIGRFGGCYIWTQDLVGIVNSLHRDSICIFDRVNVLDCMGSQ